MNSQDGANSAGGGITPTLTPFAILSNGIVAPIYFCNAAYPEYTPAQWEQALPWDYLIYVGM